MIISYPSVLQRNMWGSYLISESNPDCLASCWFVYILTWCVFPSEKPHKIVSVYTGIHSLMLEIESAFQYFEHILSFPCWGRISVSYLFTSDLSFKRWWCCSISVTLRMNYKKTSLTFSGFQGSEEDFCKRVRSQKKFRYLKETCSKMWKKGQV